ncbi:hypothetical protein GBF38_020022 [Nibea albiflora]|uniref:Uncharacterized protein n=1 Tax=Nibea albiflora TaxID=240163 RepID=A0ACB7FCQ2_NIBAL|nr:hypothetical protein GBF38_020022 [Nibea albiflora]
MGNCLQTRHKSTKVLHKHGHILSAFEFQKAWDQQTVTERIRDGFGERIPEDVRKTTCGRWLQVSRACCATNHVRIDKDHPTKQGGVEVAALRRRQETRGGRRSGDRAEGESSEDERQIN